MGYYCNQCKEDVSEGIYNYSKDKFGRPLCKNCQEGIRVNMTLEAKKLGEKLQKKGWNVQFEKDDGFKTIDLAIVKAKVNIEVDGPQHNLRKRQALADLKRTYHSFRKGFLTLRIPNSLVKDDDILEETADYIDEFLNESCEQLDD